MALTPAPMVSRGFDTPHAPTTRIASLDAYWAYYLSEHRTPVCRWLHFLGTSVFFAAVGASVVAHPVAFPVAMAAVVGLVWWSSSRAEPRGPAWGPLLVMMVLVAVASPLYMLLGVGVAYALAWVGHAAVEHNRPATLQYPVWSLLADFRMWGEMVRGRLWSGDPLDELGLLPLGDDLQR